MLVSLMTSTLRLRLPPIAASSFLSRGPGTGKETAIRGLTSVADIHIMADLLNALGGDAMLIVIGGTFQLSSVGPGAFLRNAIASGVAYVEFTVTASKSGFISASNWITTC
jgi:hypothetical protein